MTKLWNFVFFLVIILVKLSSTRDLISLVIIHRHGDRTPYSFYTNDPYQDPKYWPVGVGQLTSQGKQRMYDFGRKLRTRYHAYLSQNPREAHIQSSSKDRCIESAFYLASGLYPPKGHFVWNTSHLFQAFSIYSSPEVFDRVSNLFNCIQNTSFITT